MVSDARLSSPALKDTGVTEQVAKKFAGTLQRFPVGTRAHCRGLIFSICLHSLVSVVSQIPNMATVASCHIGIERILAIICEHYAMSSTSV